MRAGRGEPTTVAPNTFVTNVSAINTYALCDQKWFNQYVRDRVRPTEKEDFQQTGTVGHAAIEDLHQQMGKWEPDAALGIAEKHATKLETEIKLRGHLMSEKSYEKRAWFAEWLRDALPIYAQKYKSVPWDEVLMVEEALWLEISVEEMLESEGDHMRHAGLALDDAGYKHVLIVGRPDAVVLRNDKVWHVQRKFFSGAVDLVDFIERAQFQKHEVVYLVMFQQLYEQGDLPAPAGHTMFDLIRKLDIPQHPSELSPPKKCKCGAADGADQLAVMAVHTKMSSERIMEHCEEEIAKQKRFAGRVEAKSEAYDTWLNRAFIRDDARYTKKQRASVFSQTLYDIGQMAALKVGDALPTSKEGWGCNAFFRPCHYKGVCAGRESLDGPQFAPRPESYIDIPEEGDE